MEEPQGFFSTGDGCVGDTVTERCLVESKEPVSHVQLACGLWFCAFPLDGNELCVWSTKDPSYQVPKKFCVLFDESRDLKSLAVDLDCIISVERSRDDGASGLPGQEGCSPGRGAGRAVGPSVRTGARLGGNTHLACALVRARPSAPGVHMGWQGPTCLAAFWTAAGVCGPENEPRPEEAYWPFVNVDPVCTSMEEEVELRSVSPELCHGGLFPVSGAPHLQTPPGRTQVPRGRLEGMDVAPAATLSSEEVIALQVTVELRSGRGRLVFTGQWVSRKPETVEHQPDRVRFWVINAESRLPAQWQLLPSESAPCLWVGSSSGLLILNLANFELEGVLRYKGKVKVQVTFDLNFVSLSIQVAGSCAMMSKAGEQKAICLLTSMFGGQIAVLEIRLAALVRSRQGLGAGRSLSVLPRGCVLSTSPLHFRIAEERRTPPAPQRRSAVRSTVQDQPLVFHGKVRSSGYATARHVTMFSPKTNTRNNGDSPSRRRGSHRCSPPTRLHKQRVLAHGPAAALCVQFSGDGRWLACGLANHLSLVFRADLTGTPAVFSGHDGAVSTVCWSHDGRWLLSTSLDGMPRVWSLRRAELVLCVGRDLFPKPIQSAQFYYLDAFILCSSGPELQLLKCHIDTSKDEIRRYKQRSRCRPVFRLPTAGPTEITSLSAANDFYSCILPPLLALGGAPSSRQASAEGPGSSPRLRGPMASALTRWYQNE
ncbi:Hypothetical predicted protein [Lynx pardinus]|uniref:Uncharacterized protein n=1 Tax=Lynx pardinus TaxID=191816 RepID=A0A485N4A4_LYNPA|nr:Hypothetical predicted protein [Lynx pardinus]